MAVIRYGKVLDFITLSSWGFPNTEKLGDGSTLTFIDTGLDENWPLHKYVCLGGVWEKDPR
jgi:hypothetical protein